LVEGPGLTRSITPMSAPRSESICQGGPPRTRAQEAYGQGVSCAVDQCSRPGRFDAKMFTILKSKTLDIEWICAFQISVLGLGVEARSLRVSAQYAETLEPSFARRAAPVGLSHGQAPGCSLVCAVSTCQMTQSICLLRDITTVHYVVQCHWDMLMRWLRPGNCMTLQVHLG